MRVAVYIDGFNFFYWLKPLPYRWIDFQTLVLNAIAKPDKTHKIIAVKYFTARVSDTAQDPQKSTRQDIYFQALQAVTPNLSIYYGEFRRQKKYMPRVTRNGGVGKLIRVWHTEEKGSDVNLAVELVNDAWANLYDMAVVVSNDSDLERAVRIAKKKGHTIGVLVRGDAKVTSLKKVSSFIVKLTTEHLDQALLPLEIPNTAIRIPPEWEEKEVRAGLRNKG